MINAIAKLGQVLFLKSLCLNLTLYLQIISKIWEECDLSYKSSLCPQRRIMLIMI